MPRPTLPRRAFLLFLLLGGSPIATARLAAQEHRGASPYTDMQAREIKALSPDEVAGLLAGDGIGFALPAELNGVPGPKHVIELADSLGLTAEQRRSIEGIRRSMRTRAIELGTALVEAERALDALFAGGAATEDAVRAALERAEGLRAELREAHLLAHLETADELGPEQIARYRHLRGYHTH
jgi:Spy/CpxP family protein refolding chaperone